ncbi:hypothetical protein [Arthrobacter sp. zg-Y179]|uniref:hypothetical protein n=1 Tax=Arthrobacter sp. zg-Y179 TaxID=2894188 RepID=UPI001E4F3D07|nr:hypothetical protein [Arthrobacter sp. zg-Y179]MCC9175548.1 hypothetical protein [Arthrobacter sp. zg-Y179]
MPESFTASQAPAAGSWMRRELHSQPDVWERAIAQAHAEDLLPPPGKPAAGEISPEHRSLMRRITVSRHRNGEELR